MSLPIRKRIRLENYDYSTAGYYFVTICSSHHKKLFGDITNVQSNHVELNFQGRIIQKHIQMISQHYENVKIEKYVITPNHIHMLVIIGCDDNTDIKKNPNLSHIIGLFKSGVSRELGQSVWQTRFHDHVIRDEKAYLKIWNYIDTNPLKWKQDIFYVN